MSRQTNASTTTEEGPVLVDQIDLKSLVQPRTYKLEDFQIPYEQTSENLEQSFLDKGGQGVILKAIDVKTGTEHVLKKLLKYSNSNAVLYLKNQKEIYIHAQLNHKNIISLRGFFEQYEYDYMVLEFSKRGNLRNYLKQKSFLTESEATGIVMQLCQGLEYIHRREIIHRDIKPENILLDRSLNVKICDFGLSQSLRESNLSSYCGTLNYMAPEIFFGNKVTEKIDIWSVGVLFYQLVNGQLPLNLKQVPKEHIKQHLTKFQQIKHTREVSMFTQNIIQALLTLDPAKRPSAKQVLEYLSFQQPQNQIQTQTSRQPQTQQQQQIQQSRQQANTQSTTNQTPFSSTFSSGMNNTAKQLQHYSVLQQDLQRHQQNQQMISKSFFQQQHQKQTPQQQQQQQQQQQPNTRSLLGENRTTQSRNSVVVENSKASSNHQNYQNQQTHQERVNPKDLNIAIQRMDLQKLSSDQTQKGVKSDILNKRKFGSLQNSPKRGTQSAQQSIFQTSQSTVFQNPRSTVSVFDYDSENNKKERVSSLSRKQDVDRNNQNKYRFQPQVEKGGQLVNLLKTVMVGNKSSTEFYKACHKI